jgi:hypothetical protein
MHRTWLIRTTLAVAVTAAVTEGIVDVAPAASTAQTEHLTVISTTNPSAPASVIATGHFTAGGTVLSGKTAETFKLPGGTFQLRPTIKEKFSQNTATCYFAAKGTGTYTISHGTGRYTGITGSGDITFTEVSVVPKTATGACAQNGAYQKVINLTGPVALPKKP